jgi:hypothetical protein
MQKIKNHHRKKPLQDNQNLAESTLDQTVKAYGINADMAKAITAKSQQEYYAFFSSPSGRLGGAGNKIMDSINKSGLSDDKKKELKEKALQQMIGGEQGKSTPSTEQQNTTNNNDFVHQNNRNVPVTEATHHYADGSKTEMKFDTTRSTPPTPPKKWIKSGAGDHVIENPLYAEEREQYEQDLKDWERVNGGDGEMAINDGTNYYNPTNYQSNTIGNPPSAVNLQKLGIGDDGTYYQNTIGIYYDQQQIDTIKADKANHTPETNERFRIIRARRNHFFEFDKDFRNAVVDFLSSNEYDNTREQGFIQIQPIGTNYSEILFFERGMMYNGQPTIKDVCFDINSLSKLNSLPQSCFANDQYTSQDTNTIINGSINVCYEKITITTNSNALRMVSETDTYFQNPPSGSKVVNLGVKYLLDNLNNSEFDNLSEVYLKRIRAQFVDNVVKNHFHTHPNNTANQTPTCSLTDVNPLRINRYTIDRTFTIYLPAADVIVLYYGMGGALNLGLLANNPLTTMAYGSLAIPYSWFKTVKFGL